MCDHLEENITVMIEPFPICKYAPQWVEIEWTIQSLQRHRPGGTSQIQTEHLQGWLVAATRVRETYTVHWYRVVDLVQMSFRDSNLPTY